jgi:hypothetical protein
MFDFSGDEFLFFLFALVAGLLGLFLWYRTVLAPARFRDGLGAATRYPLAALPIVCLAVSGGIIWRWSDPVAVAGHLDYTILFLAGAAAWFGLTMLAMSAVGIHFRHDIAESGTQAAAIAFIGIATGTTAIYVGGNLGAGPTIWTTIFPAAAGSLALGLLWLALEAGSSVGDSITIDRDRASGLRTAGWAIGSSLILGRAVAGDWTGWDQTFNDFVALGWPAAVLTIAGIVLQRWFRPNPERPHPSQTAAVVSALALILAALVYVASLPPPDIGKHVITYEEYQNSK